MGHQTSPGKSSLEVGKPLFFPKLHVFRGFWVLNFFGCVRRVVFNATKNCLKVVVEGSLNSKLPTIWRVEKQR